MGEGAPPHEGERDEAHTNGEEPGRSDGSAREESVGTAATRGFLWANVGVATRYVSALVLAVVLVRVLDNAEYAAMVTLMVLTYYLDNSLDMGLGAALVYEQEKGITHRVQVAFTATIGLTAVLATTMFVAAPLIASYFKMPEYAWLLRCLAVVVILSGATAIPWSLFVREMEFKQRALVEVSRDMGRFVVTLGLAVAGFGAWSVMIGLIAAYATWLTMTWYFMRFRPVITWDLPVAKQLFSYAWRMAGSRLLGVLSLNGDYVIIGNRRPDQYPQYYQAFRLPEFVMGAQLNAMSAVLFPMYSRIRSEGKLAMSDALYRALGFVSLFSLPVGVALSLVSRDAIGIMYGLTGNEADVAISTMEILSLTGCVVGLGFATGDLLFAIGRPGVMVRINGVMVPLMLGLMWFVSSHGVVWVAVVHLAVAVVFTFIRQLVVNHIVDASGIRVLQAMGPGIIVTACIAALALPVRLLTDGGFTSLVMIVVAGIAGGFLGLALSPTARREVAELIARLRG